MQGDHPPQISPDLENQLSAPGGQFPGTAETLATPVGSDKPVRVVPRQKDNRHLQLSKAEFRARSARQRAIDAQAGPISDQTPELEATLPLPNPTPKKRSSGRPKGVRNKPKPAVPKGQPIGRPYPAPSTTAAPTPAEVHGVEQQVQVVDSSALEERMSRLEAGMDKIVQAISERDQRQEHVAARGVPDDWNDEDDEYSDEQDEKDDTDRAPEPGESCDKPVEDDPGWDVGLQELQQMIARKNPQRLFRRHWCQLSRAAQFNEWTPARREIFDTQFNAIVAHPKFIHQMSRFLRGSRNGNCIGNEQIARVCGMVAGFLTVYQLAAAGK